MLKTLSFIFVLAVVCGVSQAQLYGRPRPCPYPAPRSCDLGTLLQLAKKLNEPAEPAAPAIDVDSILIKLIDALIFTTARRTGNDAGIAAGNGGPSIGSAGTNSGSDSAGLVGSLLTGLDVDLLGPGQLARVSSGNDEVLSAGVSGTTNTVARLLSK